MNASQRAMIRQKNSQLKAITNTTNNLSKVAGGLINTSHQSNPSNPNVTYSLAYSALHPAPGLYVHIEPKFDRVRVKGPRLSVPQYTQKLDIPHHTKYRTFLEAAGYTILPSMRASRLPGDLIRIVSANDLLRVKKLGEVEDVEGIDIDEDDTDTETILDNAIDLGGLKLASDKLALAQSLGFSLVYRTPQDAMKLARPYSGGSEADKRLRKARIQAAGIRIIE